MKTFTTRDGSPPGDITVLSQPKPATYGCVCRLAWCDLEESSLQKILVFLQHFEVGANDLGGAFFTHPVTAHLIIVQPFLEVRRIGEKNRKEAVRFVDRPRGPSRVNFVATDA
jgi:hypothetical protein